MPPMPLSRVRPLLLLVLAGCAGTPSPPPDAAWTAVVTERIHDGARAFLAEGDGFGATVAERGMSVYIAEAGARFSTGGEPIQVRTLTVGRGADGEAVRPAPAALGECGERVDPTGACIRRVELVSDVGVEWWTATPDGFEQGWRFETPAPGTGALGIDLAVEGAGVIVGDGEVQLDGDGHLTVSAFDAWDATGRPLDVRLVRIADGFRIEIDDTTARYPIEVDPVYTTAMWAVNAPESHRGQGTSSSAAGDVNADGYDDVLVGAWGASYLYMGSAVGLSTDAAAVLANDAGAAGHAETAAGAGDLNGDGYPDVAVGIADYNTYVGRVYIYMGSAAGLSTTPALTMDGGSTEEFGGAVAGAGDVNADGYDDLIVGASRITAHLGRAYVFHGSPAGLTTTPAVTLSSASATYFGHSVDGAGDVDGDGYDDVIVGSQGYNGAFLFRGSATGLGTTPATTVVGVSPAVLYGAAVAGAGDVDGDGYDDVIVSDPGYDSQHGRVYVYLGSSTGLSSSASNTLAGEATQDLFGWSVAGAGDVNHDGYADIAVGADTHGVDWTGRAYVFPGSIGGVSGTALATYSGEHTGAYYGYSVAGAGDVNGDGYDDVLIGAYNLGGGRGRSYLYTGMSTGLSASAATTLDGAYVESLGVAVAGGGDVNGDGHPDVLIGAPGYHGAAGAVFVYQGTGTGLPTAASTTLTGTTSEDLFGDAVAFAGDVDNDGFDDVIVGADGYNSSMGRAYVFRGAAGGVSTSPTTTMTGAGASYLFGGSVAGAGDVNHDGYDDVIVGAEGYSSSKGAAYVYLGSSLGTATSYARALTGSLASDHFGCAVAGAGDVNHDGYADVIVGSSGYSSSTGRAQVYNGTASGTTGIVSSTLNGYGVSDNFGGAVAGVGDVNGDGYDDVVVGAYGYSSSTGRIYVYPGGATGTPTAPTVVVSGGASSDRFGWAVSGAGDVNADGYDDVIVGAYQHASYSGQAAIYEGSAAGLVATATATITSGTASAELGYAVDGAGDIDGDGFADVIVGAPSVVNYGSGGATVYRGYADGDGDGVGSADDCNDADPSITAPILVYADDDGDGYGNVTDTLSTCVGVAGYVSDASDCDDTNATVHPGTTEQCDGANTDEDCDGLVDDADAGATGKTTVYADSDGDGYGGAAATFCDPPSGYVAAGTDCDDGNATIHPTAAEVCDALDTDEDCDGLADDADPSATGRSAVYADGDGDGHGAGAAIYACDAAAGYTAVGDDCDDGDAAISPAATEQCDPADQDEDCDGLADDRDSSAVGASTWYADTDADGYGGTATISACDAPSGYVATSTDCADSDAAIHPGATERCDAGDADEDCDGLVDDADPSVTGQGTFYLDADGDGYGSASTVSACDQPVGAVTSAGDCDDTRAAVHPESAETTGDGIDEDCDGTELCYVDADGDGARVATTLTSADTDCVDAGEALASAVVDCDDADASIHGGAAEVIADGIDQDCDGLELCYVDGDDDGYRDGETTVETATLDCSEAGQATADAPDGDCVDTDPAYHPGAEESDCRDPNDYNCDGSVGYADADADGFPACEECDDHEASVNPDAVEVCDGHDDDCDGTSDVNAVDAGTWYADGDDDGYTDPAVVVTACEAPAGYTAATADDCDDTDAASHPGATDIPDDGIDQDCDGVDAVGDTGTGDDTGSDTASDTGSDSGTDSGGDDTAGGDTGGDGDTAAATDKATGCGCTSAPANTLTGGAGLAGLLLLGWGVARRRGPSTATRGDPVTPRGPALRQEESDQPGRRPEREGSLGGS